MISRSFVYVGLGFAVVQTAGAAGPYFKIEAGPSITEDTTIKEFLGVPPNSKIEFDPGFRFAFGGGYQLNDFIAIGGETGISYNGIDDIEGASSEGDSSIGSVPLLANVVVKFPTPTGLVPFAGAGVGVAFAFINADTIVVPTTGGAGAGTAGVGPVNDILDGSDSDAVFAWQLFAGLKYQLNPNMALGLSYKYLQVESPEWEAEDQFGTEQNLRIGHLDTHAVTFVFSMSF